MARRPFLPPASGVPEEVRQRLEADARPVQAFARQVDPRHDPRVADALARFDAVSAGVREVEADLQARLWRQRKPFARSKVSLASLKAYLNGLVDDAVRTERLLWYRKVRADCVTQLGVTHAMFLKAWAVVPDYKEGKQVKGKGRPPKSIWDE